jgi:hypothetical protein
VNWNAALTASAICKSVYLDETAETAALRELGFTEVKGLRHEATHALVCSNKDVVVIAFRGTADLSNWLINCDLRRHTVSDGEAHRGFYESMDAFYPELKAAAKTQGSGSKAVCVTGHSLGGAMAVLFAYEATRKGDLKISSLVTFGQPLPLSMRVAEYMNSQLGSRFRRFVNGADVVTRLLPKFHHAGSRIHLTASGFELLPPAVSYRDLKEAGLEDAEAMTEEEFGALRQKVSKEGKRDPATDATRGLMSWLNDHSMDLYDLRLNEMNDRQHGAVTKIEVKSASDVNPPGNGKKKRVALLVGINQYSDPAIPQLHGAVNDVHKMQDLLLRDYDFETDDITILTNEHATRRAILEAFRKQLIQQADPNTIAVLHYSGHGSQIPDKNGDEPDGLDETIVPYDSSIALESERDIADDTLGELLRELRATTPLITVILDCCHSGDGTREIDQPREIKRPVTPQTVAGAKDDLPPDYAVIGGCRSNEQSYEYGSPEGPCGALTYFLVEAARSAKARTAADSVTYQDVMEWVSAHVSDAKPRQHPVIDGVAGNREFFGARTITSERYVLVKDFDGKVVNIDAGRVHGLTPGSILEVFPPRTKSFRDPSLSVARIKLTDVEPFASQAEVQGVSRYRMLEPLCRAVIRVHQSEDDKFAICLDSGKDNQMLMQSLEAILLNRDFAIPVKIVGLDELPRITIRRLALNDDKKLGDRYAILAGDGTELSSVPFSADLTADPIGELLIGWMQWFRVGDLNNRNDLGKLATLQIDCKAPNANDTQLGVQLTTTLGKDVTFTVTNETDENIYYGLLDLSNDGSIGVIDARGQNQPLAPRRSFSISTPTVIPSDDRRSRVIDDFLLIATTQPTDFKFLEQPSLGARDLKELDDPLGTLLAQRRFGSRQVAPRILVRNWSTDKKRLEVLK